MNSRIKRMFSYCFPFPQFYPFHTTLQCSGKISVAWAATHGKLSCAAWEVLVVVVVNSSLKC